jgi:hypothetical protein
MADSADGLLRDLQRWYARHCDGTWEHHQGVRIESLDNPGWWVTIDLSGTELAGRPFGRVAENVDAGGWPAGDRWLCCYVEDGVWHGAGDETKLAAILRAFLMWGSGAAADSTGAPVIPLYADPEFTFRFAEDRLVARFHLTGVEQGESVAVYRMDADTGDRLDHLTTGTAGEGGWVDLPEPIVMRAGQSFVAVPAQGLTAGGGRSL